MPDTRETQPIYLMDSIEVWAAPYKGIPKWIWTTRINDKVYIGELTETEAFTRLKPVTGAAKYRLKQRKAIQNGRNGTN